MKKGVLYRKIDGKNRNQGGFTLVELIVVISIVLILAGGAVFGVMTWIRWSQFKEQNEYAKTLFSAAQNHLTEYSENGQLGVLQQVLYDNDEYKNQVKVNELVNNEGGKYSLDSLWPASVGKIDKEKYRGEICYLKGDAQTYRQYQEYKTGGGEKPDAEIVALYDLLLPYVYDPSILDAAVSVEFTPEDGQVFSVLYSNKNEKFEYGSSDGKAVDITNREYSVRKQKMLGYYGVDTLSKATSTKAQKPSLTDVKLNNEDTLDLSFRLSKVKEALTAMTYEITICDKDTKEKKLVIQLDGTRLQNKESESRTPVICNVSKYDSSGNRQEAKEFPVLAWLEENASVRVILDAADLSASSACYNSAFDLINSEDAKGTSDVYETFKKSYSFHRFGVDTEDIFCTVKGSGAYYKPTAKKQSNSANTYFSSYKSAENNDNSSTNTYALTSIRHLYNIRYREDKAESARDIQVTYNVYQLAKNIDWKKFISQGNLYDTDQVFKDEKTGTKLSSVIPVEDKNTSFPSVMQLKSTSTLESKGEKAYSISGITLLESSNSKVAAYGTIDVSGTIQNVKNGAVGLFVQNNGEIRKLILDQITVKGTESVGAFCGKNAGLLSELTVNNSKEEESPSTVSGSANVGGITGEQITKSDTGTVELKGLVNRAAVTGTTYVGGIAGHLQADSNNSILVERCTNYGVVEAVPFSKEKGTDAATAKYIGGITGFSDNASHDEKKLQIKKCISSPQYTSAELNELFQEGNEEILSGKLNGIYVGGIAGYNRNGLIEDCSTEQEKNREGFIFGYQFVGGIVGFNESETVALDGKESINEANVIGDSYVGGISGCNSGSSAGSDDIRVPDLERDVDKKISNWINKGIVAASGNYVGGITGVNAGIIENCSSEVTSDDTARKITDAQSLHGNYAGGIAGYNNGIIRAAESGQDYFRKTISLVSYIAGNNFVGGIVGYNDVEASVEDYILAGGYIKGTGTFVGGYTGVNASKALLENQVLQSNPNEVTGRYCVSGVIGGNIVASSGDIQAEFNSDNFWGNVDAVAFTGGYIGYNRLLQSDMDENSDRNKTEALINSITETFDGNEYDLEDIVQTVWDISGEETESRLTIEGFGDSSNQLIKFGSLNADIYVGGVVGYNDPDTRLTITNVVNKTPVTARKEIANSQERPDSGDFGSDEFLFSYAGGIIGKVDKYVVVDNCSNQDVGDVTAQGTYLGGICEVNEGLVRNCSVSSIGSSDRSYVGGIAGLNKGMVEDCSFTGKTITGKNYVGGMVSENYGTIKAPYLFQANIVATGDYVGGAAGYNYESGIIQLTREDSGDVNVNSLAIANVSSSGNYIGGITGVNLGNLSSDHTFTVSGSVNGNINAGGFAGYNLNQPMQKLINYASVTAVNGTAGGITGESTGAIRECINNGFISAAKSGAAGGIVSINNSEIKDCTDTQIVSASNGDCGGIAGENNGSITDCNVEGSITFSGNENIGGLVGKNNKQGQIKGCTIQNITVENMDNSGSSNIGGIAGINSGDIILNRDAVHNTELYSYTSKSNIGGIAGKNNADSRISGAGLDEVTIGFAGSNGVYANMGGVTGVNYGRIDGCAAAADITGNMGSTDTGYGGIAGINESDITNCTYDGMLRANGSADNMVNMGGITGKNNESGKIAHSYIGILKNTTIESGFQNGNVAMGYIGGMVGWNYGEIRECDNARNSTAEVKVINRAGHTGGIVGNNVKGAVVSGSSDELLSTGKKWSVESKYYTNDAGTAGIMGYSSSGRDISYVTNYADVTINLNSSNVTAGGLIGRMENNENGAMKISHYENYGNVKGILVGGAIGRIKYKGASFEKCTNYGDITAGTAAGTSIAAGLVGSYYANDITMGMPISVFTECKNFGQITSNGQSGGITAHTNPLKTITIKYSDCVNEGCIKGGTAGGIAAAISSADTYFYRCRNYGNSVSDFYGIVPQNSFKKIQDSFSITNKYGLAKSGGTMEDSYYLAQNTSAGIPLTVSDQQGQYSIQNNNSQFQITGLANNPKSGFTDSSKYTFTEAEKKQRQRVYEEIDPKVSKYYEDKTKAIESPDSPTNVSIQNKSGILVIKWGHKNKNYDQDQLVYRVIDTKNNNEVFNNFDEPIDISYGIEFYGMQIPEEYFGYTIQAYVRTVSGYCKQEEYNEAMYGPDSGKRQPGASNWVKAETSVKEPLPEPKIHIELAAYGQSGNCDNQGFVAVLDNKEDYAGNKATKVKVKLSNGKEFTIDTSNGRSTANTTITDLNDNQIITAYAEAVSDYSESGHVTLQCAFYGVNSLKNKDYVTTKFTEFYGERTGNLYNQIKMEKASNVTELYMNSELVVSDYRFQDTEADQTLTCDVAVAAGTSHVTQNSGVMTSNLNNLPDDLLDYSNMTVRTYPWQSQSYVCWYGHPVKSGITEAELISYMKNKNLLDVERKNESVFTSGSDDTKISLKAGYVIRRDSDGTYDVIYSSILANSIYSRQVKSRNYAVSDDKSKVTASNPAYSQDIQPSPVINAVYPLSSDGRSYSFVWDEGKADKNAVYDLQLKGIAKDGTEVLLKTETVDQDTPDSYHSEGTSYWTYTFRDNEEAWNYPKIILSAVRVGTTDGNNKTLKFPSRSEQSFDILLKLSQISRPTVLLHKNDTEVEKNSLSYDITWNQVPDIEREHTGAYEITVNRSDRDDEATFKYDKKEDFEKNLERYKRLYESKGGTITEEAGGQKIVYVWKENVNGAAVEKTMELSWTLSPEFTISKTLTEIWVFDMQDGDNAKNQITKMLDLNDYERGELLELSVRALAADGDTVYRHGPGGVVREMTLPSRLVVPEVTGIASEPEYKKHEDGKTDTYMTESAFTEEGISLTFEDKNENLYQGKYQIAAAVFEEPSEADIEDTSAKKAGDAPQGDSSSDYWNSGSGLIETLVTKESQTTMNGNFSSSAYVLKGIKTEYAGKWLKIALRSISESNISSWWTDEDDVTENTVNYKWIRIPRVQVEETQQSEGIKTIYYDDHGGWTLENLVTHTPVEQRTLKFEGSPYADGYRIQRVRAASDTDIDKDYYYTAYGIDWIYLEPSDDGGYYVFCSSSAEDISMENTSEEKPVCWQDDTAVYQTTIYKGGFIELPFAENAWESPEATDSITVRSFMEWESDSEGDMPVFTLVLPDAERINEYTYEKNLFTSQVSVQAVVSGTEEEGNLTRYENSPISLWFRYKQEQDLWLTDIITLPDYEREPSIGLLCEVSAYKNIAYQITDTGKNRRVYQIEITSPVDGSVLDKRYISAYGTGIDPVSILLLLPEDIYAGYAGNNISVRAADIVPESGVSRWSEWTQPAILPDITITPPEVGSQDTDMNAYFREDAHPEDTTTVTVQAEKLYWTYDQETDAKTGGYYLNIGTTSEPVKIWTDKSGNWYYKIGDGAEEYLNLGESVRLISLASQVNVSGLPYELLTDINLTASASENGVDFSVTVPLPEVSFMIGHEEAEAAFDSSVTILPIAAD
nr:type II secretion system protein [uncultured Blautia sp.]